MQTHSHMKTEDKNLYDRQTTFCIESKRGLELAASHDSHDFKGPERHQPRCEVLREAANLQTQTTSELSVYTQDL